MEKGGEQEFVERWDDDSSILEQNEKELDYEFESKVWQEQNNSLPEGYFYNWMDNLIDLSS